MAAESLLTKVIVENYRSIASCEVPLGPCNFLVGPNGSGKTNFLDAIRFVGDAVDVSCAFALSSRGSADHLLHVSHHRKAAYFRIELHFDLAGFGSGQFELRLGRNPSGFIEIQEERCEVLGPENRTSGYLRANHQAKVELPDGNRPTFPPAAPDKLYLPLVGSVPVFQAVQDHLGRMRFYSPQPAAMCRFKKKETDDFLEFSGENITNLEVHLREQAPDTHTRVREYLEVILPGLREIVSEDLGPGRMLKFFQQPGECWGSHAFHATQMSEGTLRTFGILVALLQTRPRDGKRPSLVGIEDVESAVHPGALAAIRDALFEASHSTQVLVTTHSSDLLDDKEVPEDAVLTATWQEGETIIHPLGGESKDLVRRRLYTIGELQRLGQLVPDALPPAGTAAVPSS